MVVNSKKFFHTKQFWIVLWSRTLVATFIFSAASIWSPKAALKLGAVKSTLSSKKCSNQKILANLLCHSAVGLQIEADVKMKVATRVLDTHGKGQPSLQSLQINAAISH